MSITRPALRWTFSPHSELQNWHAEVTTRSGSRAAERRLKSGGDPGDPGGGSAADPLAGVGTPAAVTAAAARKSRREGESGVGCVKAASVLGSSVGVVPPRQNELAAPEVEGLLRDARADR